MSDLTSAVIAGVPLRCVPPEACVRCVPDIELSAVLAVLGWLPLCNACCAVLQAEAATREAQR